MKRSNSNWLGVILFVVFAYGWIANIITLAHTDTFTGMVILRAIGIFVAPLGAVLGFM